MPNVDVHKWNFITGPAHGITSEDGLESSKFFENRPAPSRMNPGRYLTNYQTDYTKCVLFTYSS